MAIAPSVKDLTIAEHLQRLSQFNRNRPRRSSSGSDDNNDDSNGRPPPPTQPQPPLPPYDFLHRILSPPLSDDDDDDNDAPPPLAPSQKLAQKLMLDDNGSTTAETKNAAVKKKIVLSKNLNYAFPEAQEFLAKTDNDMPEITPHSKTLLCQLNRVRLPEQLESFAGGSNHKSGNKHKAYGEERVGGRLKATLDF